MRSEVFGFLSGENAGYGCVLFEEASNHRCRPAGSPTSPCPSTYAGMMVTTVLCTPHCGTLYGDPSYQHTQYSGYQHTDRMAVTSTRRTAATSTLAQRSQLIARSPDDSRDQMRIATCRRSYESCQQATGRVSRSAVRGQDLGEIQGAQRASRRSRRAEVTAKRTR